MGNAGIAQLVQSGWFVIQEWVFARVFAALHTVADARRFGHLVFAARRAELRRFAAKNLQAVEKDREWSGRSPRARMELSQSGRNEIQAKRDAARGTPWAQPQPHLNRNFQIAAVTIARLAGWPRGRGLVAHVTQDGIFSSRTRNLPHGQERNRPCPCGSGIIYRHRWRQLCPNSENGFR